MLSLMCHLSLKNWGISAAFNLRKSGIFAELVHRVRNGQIQR